MPGTYEGRAFHDDFPGGRGEGSIRLSESILHFEGGGKQADFPLEGLTLERGGAAGRLIFFKHPSRPDWTVYSGEAAILKDPALTSRPDIAVQIAKVNRVNVFTGALVAGVLVLMGLAAVLMLKLKDPAVRIVADRVPVSWEKKFGDSVFAQMKRGERLIETPEVVAGLGKLTGPLVRAIPDKRYEFKFHIVDKAQVNAFALPGGHVIVHTGLILKADSPEEVLGVLAHEIAHVSLRHSVRQIIQTAGLYLVVQALFGDMTGILAVAADQGAFLAARKFSRGFEREADETGWSYLIAARIDPRGMASFFRKLDEDKNSAGKIENALSFLSTHPASADRARYLDKKWQTMYTRHRFYKVEMDFKAFQDSLKGNSKAK